MKNISRWIIWSVLCLAISGPAMALVSTAPIAIDQSGVNNGVQIIGTPSFSLGSGSNVIGKVGIDQTTPGTTNGVQVNAALPAGSNNIGAVDLGSTFYGTAGSGATKVLTVQGSASGTPIPVTVSGGSAATRSDTFTSTTSGTTVDVHTSPVKYFSLAVAQTGTVTSWTVVLECSLDNTNFTTVLTHTNTSPGTGQIVFGGTSATPCLYFRSRTTALTLGAGTNVVATILGT